MVPVQASRSVHLSDSPSAGTRIATSPTFCIDEET